MSDLRIKHTELLSRLTILFQGWIDQQLHAIVLSLSVSRSVLFSQTHCTAAVSLPTYMFTAERNLLLEAVKSHSGKYRKLLTEARVDNAGWGETGCRKKFKSQHASYWNTSWESDSFDVEQCCLRGEIMPLEAGSVRKERGLQTCRGPPGPSFNARSWLFD